MAPEHDPRISEIFYYFETHTTVESGRTMGRKIGVVQEILTKKLLLSSPRLRDAIVYEQKVAGRSGASHKVEFMFFQPLGAAHLKVGQAKQVPGVPGGLEVELRSVDPAARRAQVAVKFGKTAFSRMTMAEGQPCPIGLRKLLHDVNVQVKLAEVTASSARLAALAVMPPVASVESKRVGAQRFAGTDKLGSGIQTIEKAKQASLVAIDYDLAFNKTFLPLGSREKRRDFRSIVVLGNGVHWTQNDLSILGTYVDYTYLARDEALIRYFEYVRAKSKQSGAGFKDYFISYFAGMTKTPPDTFAVTADDFVPMVPQGAPNLIDAIEVQLAAYPTA